MDQNTFISILLENDPESMKDFLLRNGKKPKPICPIIFHLKEEEEELKNE